MSSDFVFIDKDPVSDQPIIDGISLNRLCKEWNAVKVDIKEPENQIKDSSISVWDKLLTIYDELEQANKDSATIFSHSCINDVRSMLHDSQYQRSKELIYSFFISFMKIKNCTFLDIDKNCAISILNSLIPSYKDIKPDFLSDFLNVFKANEIEDDHANIPFYTFLIKSYPNNDLIGEKSRSILIEIISEKKNNLKHLLNALLDNIVDLFCFFSDISPTIFDNSHPLTLCRFIDTFFSLIETEIEYSSELIDRYLLNLQKKLIEKLKDSPLLIQFETFNFFLSSIHHTKTTSLFIEYMIQKDSVFSQKVESWLTKWPQKTLLIFSTMIDIRSSALMTAFFFVDDTHSNMSNFGFTEYPNGFIQKVEKRPISILSIDDFTIYQSFNADLPAPSDHSISLFNFILSLFERFWSLPIQTDEILITAIEKVACCGNESTNEFCFRPGNGICEKTQELIKEAESADKEHKNLLANFVLTMKKILNNLDIQK